MAEQTVESTPASAAIISPQHDDCFIRSYFQHVVARSSALKLNDGYVVYTRVQCTKNPDGQMNLTCYIAGLMCKQLNFFFVVNFFASSSSLPFGEFITPMVALSLKNYCPVSKALSDFQRNWTRD